MGTRRFFALPVINNGRISEVAHNSVASRMARIAGGRANSKDKRASGVQSATSVADTLSLSFPGGKKKKKEKKKKGKKKKGSSGRSASRSR